MEHAREHEEATAAAVEHAREHEEATAAAVSMKSASEGASQQFRSLIDAQHLRSLHHLQDLILGRLQDSNAVLSHFNEYSERCYGEIVGELSRNTNLLKSMKSDLDYIFLKLRSMKAKLSATYPDALPDSSKENMLDQRPDLEKPVEFHDD